MTKVNVRWRQPAPITPQVSVGLSSSHPRLTATQAPDDALMIRFQPVPRRPGTRPLALRPIESVALRSAPPPRLGGTPTPG